MDSHDINYQAWAVYENLNAFTAAALWCNRNPYIYYKWSDLEFIEVRNLIINLIAHSLRAENYPEDKLKIVAIELGRQFDKGRFECAEEAMKFVISRSQLKDIAEKAGIRPMFLYFNNSPPVEHQVKIDTNNTLSHDANNERPIPLIDYSGLLNTPAKADAWFTVIDDMVRCFYEQNKRLPNDVQAWGNLSTAPPNGYMVTTGMDRGEPCLNMPSVKSLSKSAFAKRWKKYTNNAQ